MMNTERWVRLFAGLSLCVTAAWAGPQEELAEYTRPDLAHLRLAAHVSPAPTIVVIAGEVIYFSGLDPNGKCKGRGIFSIRPEGVTQPVLADICVSSLQWEGQNLYVEYENKADTALGVLQITDQKTQIVDMPPSFYEKQSQLWFAAHELSPGWPGGKFYKKQFCPFPGGGRVGCLLPAASGQNMLIGNFHISDLDDETKVREWEKLPFTLTEATAVRGGDFYTLWTHVDVLNERYSGLARVPLQEGKVASWGVHSFHPKDLDPEVVEPEKWSGRDLKYLTETPEGGVLMVDRTREPGESEILWYHAPADQKFHRLAGIPVRDVSAIATTHSGIAIARGVLGVIDWYGPPNLADQLKPWAKADLAAPPPNATTCGTNTVRQRPDGVTEIGTIETPENGLSEYVSLAYSKDLTGATWACSDQSLVFLTKQLELDLVRQHLELKVTFRDKQNPSQTNVESIKALLARNGNYAGVDKLPRLKRGEAVIKGDQRMLFVMVGRELRLVRTPLAGTEFETVTYSKDQKLYELPLKQGSVSYPHYINIIPADGHRITSRRPMPVEAP
jgi:hypothetical protein